MPALILLSLFLDPASTTSAPIPVVVTNAAKERAARGLASAVMKELKRDQRFALVEQRTPAVLDIALPAEVGWERRLDWTEIHYQVRLTGKSGRSQVIKGQCYNWNLGACAKQILNAAVGAAES